MQSIVDNSTAATTTTVPYTLASLTAKTLTKSTYKINNAEEWVDKGLGTLGMGILGMGIRVWRRRKFGVLSGREDWTWLE